MIGYYDDNGDWIDMSWDSSFGVTQDPVSAPVATTTDPYVAPYVAPASNAAYVYDEYGDYVGEGNGTFDVTGNQAPADVVGIQAAAPYVEPYVAPVDNTVATLQDAGLTEAAPPPVQTTAAQPTGYIEPSTSTLASAQNYLDSPWVLDANQFMTDAVSKLTPYTTITGVDYSGNQKYTTTTVNRWTSPEGQNGTISLTLANGQTWTPSGAASGITDNGDGTYTVSGDLSALNGQPGSDSHVNITYVKVGDKMVPVNAPENWTWQSTSLMTPILVIAAIIAAAYTGGASLAAVSAEATTAGLTAAETATALGMTEAEFTAAAAAEAVTGEVVAPTFTSGTLGTGTFDTVGSLLDTTIAPTVGQGGTLTLAPTAGTGAMGTGLGGAATTLSGEVIPGTLLAADGTAAAGAATIAAEAPVTFASFAANPALTIGTQLGNAMGIVLDPSIAQIIGSTIVSGGDLEAALKSAGLSYVGGQLSTAINSVLSNLPVDSIDPRITNALTNAATAALTGKDPLQALLSSGASAATQYIVGGITGFSSLPKEVQTTVSAAIQAALVGQNPTQAAIDAAKKLGTTAVGDYLDKLRTTDLSPIDRLTESIDITQYGDPGATGDPYAPTALTDTEPTVITTDITPTSDTVLGAEAVADATTGAGTADVDLSAQQDPNIIEAGYKPGNIQYADIRESWTTAAGAGPAAFESFIGNLKNSGFTSDQIALAMGLTKDQVDAALTYKAPSASTTTSTFDTSGITAFNKDYAADTKYLNNLYSTDPNGFLAYMGMMGIDPTNFADMDSYMGWPAGTAEGLVQPILDASTLATDTANQEYIDSLAGSDTTTGNEADWYTGADGAALTGTDLDGVDITADNLVDFVDQYLGVDGTETNTLDAVTVTGTKPVIGNEADWYPVEDTSTDLGTVQVRPPIGNEADWYPVEEPPPEDTVPLDPVVVTGPSLAEDTVPVPTEIEVPVVPDTEINIEPTPEPPAITLDPVTITGTKLPPEEVDIPPVIVEQPPPVEITKPPPPPGPPPPGPRPPGPPPPKPKPKPRPPSRRRVTPATPMIGVDGETKWSEEQELGSIYDLFDVGGTEITQKRIKKTKDKTGKEVNARPDQANVLKYLRDLGLVDMSDKSKDADNFDALMTYLRS